MTELRRIEPINISDLDTEKPDTGEPICERVDPKTLFVDPAYQRSISERGLRQIRIIIEAWSWTKFKPPICAYAEHDGETVLKVMDGQHTAIAAASHPHVGEIPVMIVEAAETAAQAAAFVGQNTERLNVTPLQLHQAALVAQDMDALTVQNVCDRVGITILKTPPHNGKFGPCETVAINAIKTLVETRGEVRARTTLLILSGAGLAPVTANHIRAADLLMTDDEYRDEFDPIELQNAIFATGKAAEHEAKVFSVAHKVPLWKALAAHWFRKTRKKRKAAA